MQDPGKDCNTPNKKFKHIMLQTNLKGGKMGKKISFLSGSIGGELKRRKLQKKDKKRLQKLG